MKNIPTSLIIFPFLILLLSGVGLQFLYTKDITNNNGIQTDKLTQLQSELSGSERDKKVFSLIKGHNEYVIHINGVLKTGIELVIQYLWAVITFTIIHLVFFGLWWKNRYNKAIKKDVELPPIK